jgi:hypothetical protein
MFCFAHYYLSTSDCCIFSIFIFMLNEFNLILKQIQDA